MSQQIETLTKVMSDIVLARIESDRLTLPGMPESAHRCATLLRSPDFNMKEVVSLLQRDPLLTAQILRVANSAAYGGSDLLRSVEQAVSRLGAQKLRTLIVDVSARQLFQSRDSRIGEAFRGQWEHSLAVALLARDVAAIIGNPDSEYAYLTGLLHDIGKPVVAIMLLEAEKSLGSRQPWLGSDAWQTVIDQSHRRVGVALSTKWSLPEAICKAIADCNEYDSSDRTSIANIVCFTNSIAKRQGFYAGKVDAEDVDALIMIGGSLLGVQPDVVSRFCTGLRQRVVSEAVTSPKRV